MLNVYSGVLKHAKASSLKAETAASIYVYCIVAHPTQIRYAVGVLERV